MGNCKEVLKWFVKLIFRHFKELCFDDGKTNIVKVYLFLFDEKGYGNIPYFFDSLITKFMPCNI